MPFKSEKQRRFLWMHHPKIARRWAHEESGLSKPKRVLAALKRHRAKQRG